MKKHWSRPSTVWALLLNVLMLSALVLALLATSTPPTYHYTHLIP